MTEHRKCSLCLGTRMVGTPSGRLISCPACSTIFTPPVLDPAKVDTYLDQCSISANITIVEPVVEIKPAAEAKVGMSAEMRLSRSEKMKRSWMERKAKAAEAKAE
jgi:hypothetical protein